MHTLLGTRSLCRENCCLLALSLFLACAVLVRLSSAEINDLNLDPVFPTPLMRMLNETVAASLRMQTENFSNSVSNTSLNDLYNDNDTQQMQIRYRERKRQERLLLIQRDILQKLGFSKEPNVTSRLSDEERERMIQMFGRSLEFQHDSANIYHTEGQDNEPQGVDNSLSGRL